MVILQSSSSPTPQREALSDLCPAPNLLLEHLVEIYDEEAANEHELPLWLQLPGGLDTHCSPRLTISNLLKVLFTTVSLISIHHLI